MKAQEFRKLIREEIAKVLNESLRSGPNDAYTYPIKKSENPEDILSGKFRASWIAKTAATDLLNVFGEEMTIYKGDKVIEYLQVNSKDSGAYVYKIIRKDLRGSRVAGYIPSLYKDYDQTEDVNKTH
jgi:hypothetical protein